MCKKTDKELPLVDFYPETNSIKMESKFDERGFIEYFNDDVNKIAVDYSGLSFDSLAQVYDVLEFYTQITYVDCYPGTTLFETHKKISPSVGSNEINVMYRNEEENAVQREITYTLQNTLITTSGGTNYLEFDISFSDNENSIYFAGGAVYLAYDTLVFGSNIAFNSNNQITRGTVTQSTSTFANPYFSNGFNDSTLLITINRRQPVTTSSVFYDLTSTPTDAVHLKLEILNCNAIGSILPIVPSIHTIFSTVQVNPSSYLNYSAIIVANSISFNGCGLNIYGISPISVRGGVGDILAITGSGFGNSRGSGLVYLKNADNGGNTYMPVDSIDYISWTNNQIKIFVPSIADSMNSNRQGIGSGRVIVKDNAGFTTTPSQNDSITIRFSAYNIYSNLFPFDTFPKAKFFVNLVDPAYANAYFIRPDTNISHHSNRLACLATAIRDWVCLTAVNFKLGNDTILTLDTTSSSREDGVNYFKFGKLPAGVLARTNTWRAYNRSNGCETGWTYEIDFIANIDLINTFWADTSQTANVPPNKYDLFHVLLHELGHAHSLRHVNSPSAMMWFDTPASAIGIPANQRIIKLYNDYSAYEGGDFIITHSLTFNPTACQAGAVTVLTLDTMSNCTAGIGINELSNPITDLVLYPNPATDFITISFASKNAAIKEMNLYDYLGRTVISNGRKKIFTGKHNERLSISNLANGFYILKLSVNNRDYIQRLIKQ